MSSRLSRSGSRRARRRYRRSPRLSPLDARSRPIYDKNATSAMIPMPTRTNVGNGDGVTKASINPETSSTPTSPTATETTARPCSASTCPRGRSPGDITDHPSRIPAAPARNTAVSSSSPCGASRPSRMSPLPAWNIRPAISPRLAAFWNSTNGDRQSQQRPRTRCTGRPPRSCSPRLAGRTPRRGVRCNTTRHRG